MPGNFSKPAVTDGYVALLQYIRENFTELAKGLDASSATSLPSGAIRYNSTAKRWEKWNGSAWAELVPKASQSYDMRVAQADDIVIGATTAKAMGQIGPLTSSGGTINANSYLASGAWFVSGADAQINFPIASGGVLLVWATPSGGYLRQSYTAVSVNRTWIRYSINSGDTWSDWKELTASPDWDAASGADGFIANKPTLGTAAAADKQTSAQDATAGALMAVGAFGLGGACPGYGGDVNSINETSFYYIGSGNTNGPGFAGYLLTFKSNDLYRVQMFFRLSLPHKYTRVQVNGVWTAWTLMHDNSTMLGTVSQSGGVPTGAIIERGSNASGGYVRFADGTQICTMTVTTVAAAMTTAFIGWYRSGVITFNYPAAFAAVPNLTAVVDEATLSAVVANMSPGLSTGRCIVCRGTSGTADVTFKAIAIGRWF